MLGASFHLLMRVDVRPDTVLRAVPRHLKWVDDFRVFLWPVCFRVFILNVRVRLLLSVGCAFQAVALSWLCLSGCCSQFGCAFQGVRRGCAFQGVHVSCVYKGPSLGFVFQGPSLGFVFRGLSLGFVFQGISLGCAFRVFVFVVCVSECSSLRFRVFVSGSSSCLCVSGYFAWLYFQGVSFSRAPFGLIGFSAVGLFSM